MHQSLDKQLAALGRRPWLEEEEQHVRRARERDKRPELAYLKVKDRLRLGPEDHALLRALAEWREREAMTRNRPRRHVLTDSVLVAIAESRPQCLAALKAIDGISERAASRFAEGHLKPRRRGLRYGNRRQGQAAGSSPPRRHHEAAKRPGQS